MGVAIKAFALVGASGSGKTRLITQLIRILKERGYRVGAVKHAHHDFQIDHEGKDSFLMSRAGADTVVISSPHQVAFVARKQEDSELETLLRDHLSDFDIVLVEGFHWSEAPKILVTSREKRDWPNNRGERSCTGIVALVTDNPRPMARYPDATRFSFEQVEALADFMERFAVNDERVSPFEDLMESYHEK